MPSPKQLRTINILNGTAKTAIAKQHAGCRRKPELGQGILEMMKQLGFKL